MLNNPNDHEKTKSKLYIGIPFKRILLSFTSRERSSIPDTEDKPSLAVYTNLIWFKLCFSAFYPPPPPP